MLLEAQLEKQSDNQGTSEETEQVHEQVKSTDESYPTQSYMYKFPFEHSLIEFNWILLEILWRHIFLKGGKFSSFITKKGFNVMQFVFD